MREDEAPEIDPLFLALTRPPLVMGVPMTWFGLNFMLFGIGMIAFLDLWPKFLWVLFVCLPWHALGYLLTERDAQFMNVWMTKLQKCGPTRNKGYWKSNSYQP